MPIVLHIVTQHHLRSACKHTFNVEHEWRIACPEKNAVVSVDAVDATASCAGQLFHDPYLSSMILGGAPAGNARALPAPPHAAGGADPFPVDLAALFGMTGAGNGYQGGATGGRQGGGNAGAMTKRGAKSAREPAGDAARTRPRELPAVRGGAPQRQVCADEAFCSALHHALRCTASCTDSPLNKTSNLCHFAPAHTGGFAASWSVAHASAGVQKVKEPATAAKGGRAKAAGGGGMGRFTGRQADNEYRMAAQMALW